MHSSHTRLTCPTVNPRATAAPTEAQQKNSIKFPSVHPARPPRLTPLRLACVRNCVAVVYYVLLCCCAAVLCCCAKLVLFVAPCHCSQHAQRKAAVDIYLCHGVRKFSFLPFLLRWISAPGQTDVQTVQTVQTDKEIRIAVAVCRYISYSGTTAWPAGARIAAAAAAGGGVGYINAATERRSDGASERDSRESWRWRERVGK
ncbi:hypothetical protein EDC01DRAFT_672263 [Geopyxis carbonaria]|nr:hypothetical protein EDC01DRAFT_672263 [Geopyxis carbonaria]